MKHYPPKERILGKILEEKAVTNKGKVFIYSKDEELTYDRVNEEVNRLAHGLLQAGVKKGDRVCIMLNNCPEFVYIWFALGKIGAIEAPLNTAYKGWQLQYVINDLEPEIMIIDQQYLDRIEFVQDELLSLKKLYVFSQDGATGAHPSLKIPCEPYENLLSNNKDNPIIPVKYSDIIGIMYTSGTTGPPKGVMLPHAQQYVLGHNMAVNLEMTPDDVYYNFFPYFHNTAQAIITVAVLDAEASLVIVDRFSASRFWDDVARYRCTLFFYMPAILNILLSKPETPGDRTTLRAAWGLGASPEMFELMEKRFGITLREGYGGTEPNVVTYYLPGDKVKPGSAGRPLDTWEVKVVNEDDIELPPGKIGEIVTRPKEPYSMMLGYWKKPDVTAEAFRNLWYHTGDAGYFDEEGYLYFVDRIKDVIRRRGENISSFEVEHVVNMHPAVAESAAIAVPSELGEDEVKIVIVLKEGATLTPEELMKWCEERMAYYAVPRFVEFKEALPKTETEKVKKHELRKEGITPATWDREKAGYKIKR